MLRVLLVALFVILALRALSRLLEGVSAGMRGGGSSAGVPQRGVQMVRDPVCGTFVVPNQGLALIEGRRPVYFCSVECRDRYRAKSA